MNDILQTILANKAAEVDSAKKQRPVVQLLEIIRGLPPPRDFVGALNTARSNKQAAVIAEIKKASPSKGVIRINFDPAAIAASYAKHGATCLSVLTEQKFFQGSSEHLVQARMACPLPILRKDFMLDPYQVYEARALQADAILLIVAAIPLPLLQKLESLAHELGLAVLIEVHNEQELAIALQLKSPLIGINNRNLRDFSVSLQTTLTMLPRIPKDRLIISESGINTAADLATLHSRGVHGFLIGEALMRQPSPGSALAALLARKQPIA